MRLSEQGIKVLWGRSGGRCALCRRSIIKDAGGRAYPIGDQAHIVAKSKRGPRGDANASAVERAQPENFVLLCGSCHDLVDKAREEWPDDRLRQLKAGHEEWVRNMGYAVPISELSGRIEVYATDSDLAQGVIVRSPTRIKPGTQVSVRGTRVRHVIGIQIDAPGGRRNE